MRLSALLICCVSISCLLGAFFATCATAVPSILFLSGESVPVEFAGSSESGGELQSAAGVLHANGFSGKGSFTEAGSNAGHFNATFTGVEKGETRCHSEGDSEGTILFGEDAAELVYTSLSPIVVGLLILVKEFSFFCGATKIKKLGSVLASLGPINKEVGVSESFSGGMSCSMTVGEPSQSSYWNGKGEAETALLLVNFGTGFKKACLVGSASDIKPTKMLEIMS